VVLLTTCQHTFLNHVTDQLARHGQRASNHFLQVFLTQLKNDEMIFFLAALFAVQSKNAERRGQHRGSLDCHWMAQRCLDLDWTKVR